MAKCPICEHEMIWGGYLDTDDERVKHNYSCPNCGTDVYTIFPTDEDMNNYPHWQNEKNNHKDNNG